MIEMFDYRRNLPEIEDAVLDCVRRVLHSGRLVLGPETEAFEREFAQYLGAKHCVGVTSGTTALHVALLALGVGRGDEVITVANTCVPTIAALRLTGATPVFAEVDPDTLLMDPAAVEDRITERTRCIVPVHLWGIAADAGRLKSIADSARAALVEDCAQSLGTTFDDTPTGLFGSAGCFSFYPTKNLGAYGDAGAIVTNDDAIAATLRQVRMYGYDGEPVAEIEGMNGRISEIQAAILRLKLADLDTALARRRSIAQSYHDRVSNPAIRLPAVPDGCEPSYHQFVIRTNERDALIDHLKANGIASGVHYAVPIHEMPAYRRFAPAADLPNTEMCCSDVLSIPVHDALTDEEVDSVVDALNRFDG